MKKIRHRILAWTLSVSMVLGYAVLPDASEGSAAEAAEIPVRETTADAAGTDQILIGVEGMDYTSDRNRSDPDRCGGYGLYLGHGNAAESGQRGS